MMVVKRMHLQLVAKFASCVYSLHTIFNRIEATSHIVVALKQQPQTQLNGCGHDCKQLTIVCLGWKTNLAWFYASMAAYDFQSYLDYLKGRPHTLFFFFFFFFFLIIATIIFMDGTMRYQSEINKICLSMSCTALQQG